MGVKTWRSEKYLKWVKSQPSVVSGWSPAGDAHHIKGRGFGGTVKCCDLFTIPLTREEHDKLHSMGWESWENYYLLDQITSTLRIIERATEAGVIKI